MTPKRRVFPLLVALLLLKNANSTPAVHSAQKSSLETSATSLPSLAGAALQHEKPSNDEVEARRKKVPAGVYTQHYPVYKPSAAPGSPVDLFTPDDFQFYTLDSKGQLVKKQMTKQEIQGMIAAGAGAAAVAANTGMPIDLSHHRTKISVHEPKVSDVVQNVQNVLKHELKKPVQIHSLATSIPGSMNSQWTNMLPYILSGGTVDQHDVAQDASIILPMLNADSYVDVIPLNNDEFMSVYSPNHEHKNKINSYQPAIQDNKENLSLKTSGNGVKGAGTKLKNVTNTRPTGSISNPQSNIKDRVRPNPAEKTTFSTESKHSTTASIASSKKPTSAYTKEPTHTRVPIRPSENNISTTKLYSSNHFPSSTLKTTTKEGIYPLTMNVGPMGGFKNPEIFQKPTSYRPFYEPFNRFGPSVSTEATYRPVYTPMSQTTVSIESASPYRPVFNDNSNIVTFKPANDQYPVYQISSDTNSNLKVTIYPGDNSDRQTTRKAPSSFFNIATQPVASAFTTRKMPTTAQAIFKPNTISQLFITQSPTTPKPIVYSTTNPSVTSKTQEIINTLNNKTPIKVNDEQLASITEKKEIEQLISNVIHAQTYSSSISSFVATQSPSTIISKTASPSIEPTEATSLNYKTVTQKVPEINETEKIITESSVTLKPLTQSYTTVKYSSEKFDKPDFVSNAQTIATTVVANSLNEKNILKADNKISSSSEFKITTTKSSNETPNQDISKTKTYEVDSRENLPITTPVTGVTDLPIILYPKPQTFIDMDKLKEPLDKTSETDAVFKTEQPTISPTSDNNDVVTELPVTDNGMKDYIQITTTENTPQSKTNVSADEEASTIKVIPIYDDESLMYSTILSSPNSSSTEKSVTVEDTTLPLTETPLAAINAFQENKDSEISLPGLEEAFNNYMKEHYDSKLSTDSYDEISHLTTFPSLSYRSKSTSMPPTTLVDADKNAMLSEIDQTTFVTDYESTEPTTFYSVDVKSDSKTPENVTKIEVNDKVETPIIYLDLSKPVSSEENSTSLITEAFVTNSSFTRIKTNNPIIDIDRTINEAKTESNIPSTQHYTMINDKVPPNEVASGLIAGYPSASPIKHDINNLIKTPSMENANSVTGTSKTNKEPDQQEISTTIVPVSDEKYADQNSFTLESTADEILTTLVPNLDYKSSSPQYFNIIKSNIKTSSNLEESFDTSNNTFVPPLEKISEVINQLQNVPPNPGQLEYDFSNGISSTTRTENTAYLTVNEYLSKAAKESRNDSHVVSASFVSNKGDFQESRTEEDVITSTTKLPMKTTIFSNPKNSFVSMPSIPVSKPQTIRPHFTSAFTTKEVSDKIKATIDKSAGRINLEEERYKVQAKPTESLSKITMKNKNHYSPTRRPTSETYPPRKSTSNIEALTKRPIIDSLSTRRATLEASIRKYTKPGIIGNRPVNNNKLTSLKPSSIKPMIISITNTTTVEPMIAAIGSTVDKLSETQKEADPTTSNSKIEDDSDSADTLKIKDGISQQIKPQIVSLDHSSSAIGLDQSNKELDKDVAEFLNMCNDLSFRFWSSVNSDINPSRSLTVSPFGMLSTLAMIFLGARGLTSIQMNDILKLDDVATFNPHLVFQNITDTVTLAREQGIENAAFVRALYADRLKVRRIIPFYKEQAQQFYEGAVVDINFSTAGDISRRRTNLLIRKQTGGRIKDFVKGYAVTLRSPLTALSANVFQTSCDSSEASSEGRDGEMYFAVAQTVKQRKLVPIPAVVWKSGVSAGYEPSLDATAVALGDAKKPVSLIMIMPGQQGVTAPGDNLERLEQRLFVKPTENALEKLLKVIIPRKVELQMPKFSHRSIINATTALKALGFDHLFARSADLKGVNGAGHDLYLADMAQMNLFSTCGDENKLGSRHLSETYPTGTSPRHTRAWDKFQPQAKGNNTSSNDHFEIISTSKTDQVEVNEANDCEEDERMTNDGVDIQRDVSSVEKKTTNRLKQIRQQIYGRSIKRPTISGKQRKKCRIRRQTENSVSEKPRMKMDKPFLYLVRHNLTGLILHIGRFNPKNQP